MSDGHAAAARLSGVLNETIRMLRTARPGAPIFPAAKDGKMSKLAEMAARARKMREEHTARADAANAKMADLEKRGGEAMATIERIVTEAEQDVAAIEAEARQMTNEG